MKCEVLYNLVEDLVLNRPDAPYRRLKDDINRIDNHYFETIQRDCEEMPDELSPELKGKVEADFDTRISETYNDAALDNVVSRVLGNNTVEVTAADLTKLADKLRQRAQSMQTWTSTHEVDTAELADLYRKAKQVTIGEWITSTNKSDVIRYHHALQEATERSVRRTVDIETGRFLERLAERLSSLPC